MSESATLRPSDLVNEYEFIIELIKSILVSWRAYQGHLASIKQPLKRYAYYFLPFQLNPHTYITSYCGREGSVNRCKTIHKRLVREPVVPRPGAINAGNITSHWRTLQRVEIWGRLSFGDVFGEP
ncbi:hypothetical protein AG1IA_01841 [Rhizoctonia solani AG-1 IA]|uniref:Uncharacterized protein n=1 Tax=Thanatephorus cucumeris (strain AG1-IA) TaxID=983506 RepID=L8X660_THACA|nr:hypothetical protein AG1IA_01841 [Rhizoctonia solani AG-1 IA]